MKSTLPFSTSLHHLKKYQQVILLPLVHTICSSRDRWTAFLDTIQDGNKKGEFDPVISELELLRDVDTRWDSAYGMLNRVIPACPASNILYLIAPSMDN